MLQAEYVKFHSAGLWNYGEGRIQNRRAETVRRLFLPRIQFGSKRDAESGLELADLAAYPIARAVINGDWLCPAARVIGAKLEAMAPFPFSDDGIVFPWESHVVEPTA